MNEAQRLAAALAAKSFYNADIAHALFDDAAALIRQQAAEIERLTGLVAEQRNTIDRLMVGMPDDGTTPVIRRIAAMEAEIAALRADAERWQPIETAPPEGQFLVYMPDNTRQPMQVALWRPNVRIIGNTFAFDTQRPTHWMPLPSPPDAASKEQTK